MTRDEIWQYLTEQRGFQPHHAVGIMANIGAESGFDPSAFNPSGGGQGALGYFQHRGERQSALRDLAAKRGTNVDHGLTQLEFGINELFGPEQAAYNALMRTDNAVDAARVFRDTYERPGGHGYEATHNYAMEIAKNRGVENVGPAQFQQPYRMPQQHQIQQPGSYDMGILNQPDPEQLDMGMLAGEVARRNAGMDIVQNMLPQPGQLPSFGGLDMGEPVQAPPPPQPTVNPHPPMMPAQSLPQASPVETSVLDLPQPPEVTTSLLDDPVATNEAAKSIVDDPNTPEPAKEKVRTVIDEEDDTDEVKAEKAAKRRRIAMVLGTLSKGLGQMSVGQAVDVMGVPMEFERMAMEEKASEANQQLAKLQEQRLGQRLALDQQKFLSEQQQTARGVQASQAAAGIFHQAGMPDLAQAAVVGVPLDNLWGTYNSRMDMQTERQWEVEDRAADWKRDDMTFARERGYDLEVKEDERAYNEEQAQLLTNALASIGNGRPPSTTGMSDSTIKTFLDLAKAPERGQMYMDAVDAAQATGETPGAVLDRWRSRPSTSVQIGSSKGQEQADKNAADAHRARMTNYETMSAAASDSQLFLDNMAKINDDVLMTGGQTSIATPILAQIAGVMDALGQDTIKKIITDVGGLSWEQFSSMEADEQALAFAIARQNKGQGSITENERRAILAQVPNTKNDPKARAELIARTQFLNKVDQAMYGKYYELTEGSWQKSDEASVYLHGKVKPGITKAANAYMAMEAMNRPGFTGEVPEPPTLTKAEAEFFGPILQEIGYPGYRDSAGKLQGW